MVERRSNVLIPRGTSGKVVEQYQPITNEQVPIWPVELYNRFTADLDAMKSLVPESISKSVNIHQEMPQLVDTYMWMVRKQNTFYDQMNRGVETLCHNVYTQFPKVILQSQIFVANVKGGMAVIAAKVSQDYKNLKDTFNAQITSNNSAWARMAAVLRERQDAENALATWLEAQRLKIQDNRLNGERAMARVQNTQCMAIENNKKKGEEDLKKQRSELASTKREMKANKKQWQWAFTEFEEQLEGKLKEVPKETRCSIRSLAKSIAEDNKPENPEGNPYQPQDGARMETTSDINWIYSRKTGKWGTVKDIDSEDVSLPACTPQSHKEESGGEGASGGGEGGGGGGRGDNNSVGNSDEPLHPPFPNRNDPHDSSSSSNSSNDPR